MFGLWRAQQKQRGNLTTPKNASDIIIQNTDSVSENNFVKFPNGYTKHIMCGVRRNGNFFEWSADQFVYDYRASPLAAGSV